jgi:5-(carboxyamino)imidazole ribonucleotide synthase
MSISSIGIIGGGQLGSMLATAAKKLSIKTVIYSDDPNAPAQNFCDLFYCGKYEDENKLNEFLSNVDLVTFEFENIP